MSINVFRDIEELQKQITSLKLEVKENKKLKNLVEYYQMVIENPDFNKYKGDISKIKGEILVKHFEQKYHYVSWDAWTWGYHADETEGDVLARFNEWRKTVKIISFVEIPNVVDGDNYLKIKVWYQEKLK